VKLSLIQPARRVKTNRALRLLCLLFMRRHRCSLRFNCTCSAIPCGAHRWESVQTCFRCGCLYLIAISISYFSIRNMLCPSFETMCRVSERKIWKNNCPHSSEWALQSRPISWWRLFISITTRSNAPNSHGSEIDQEPVPLNEFLLGSSQWLQKNGSG
jgi:hypothetical protein